MSVKSFKTGNRSVSLLAGNTPEHHVLIGEATVGAGGTASVTFSNIDQSYQHLQIRAILKRSDNTNGGYLGIRPNSDTGTNYTMHSLLGNGASAQSTATTSQSNGATYGILHSDGISRDIVGSVASIFAATVIDVLDYTSTSKYKTVRRLTGWDANGSGLVSLGSGVWMSTSAVTSLYLWMGGDTFGQHSTFQLYGIK